MSEAVQPSDTAEDEYSRGIPGYRVTDYDTLCALTGKVCPEKHELVTAAMAGTTPEDVDSGEAEEVRSMVCLKLRGYDILAMSGQCTPDERCEARQLVVDHKPLQIAWGGIKAVHQMWFGIRRKFTK